MKRLLLIIVFLVQSSLIFAQVPYSEKSYDYLFGWQDIYASVPDVPNCKEGALTTAEKEYVLEYVNFIRYLHNLKPVVYDYGGDAEAQKAALIQVANGQLSHTPPSSWSCYSQEGYNGSVNSNLHIHWGISQGSQIDSRVPVVGWMIDNMSQNAQDRCGHRRAIINPFVTAISFGRVDGQGPKGWSMAAALKFMDNVNGNISDQPLEFVAYPYHNYPPNLVDKSWYLSFSPYYDMYQCFGNTNIKYDNTTVEMTDENGNSISVGSYIWDFEGWGAVHNNFRWKASGLQDEVKYNVTIKNVVVNGQNKDYTYWFRLTNNVYGVKPEAPVLSYPQNNATNVSTTVNFSWSIPSFTNKFQFQLAKDIDFTMKVKDTITTANGMIVKNLDAATTYYWHVKAINENGSSDWSQTFTFTTAEPLPDPPTLVYPPDNSTDVPRDVVLRWNTKVGAEKYHLQVSKSSNFSGFSTIDDMQITDTSYAINPSDLEYNTRYYWRVAAYVSGQQGPYSTIWSFTTKASDPVPSVATLVYPENGATNIPLNVTLQWNAVQYAQHYTVSIATDDKFSSTSKVITKNVDTNLFQVPANTLEPLTTYYWKVQAWNETGIGDWSKIYSFTTNDGSAVKEQIITDGISLSPNPINDNLYIKFIKPIDTKARLTISNLLGENVFEINLNQLMPDGMIHINTSNFAQGVYFIRINADNCIYLSKFVKN